MTQKDLHRANSRQRRLKEALLAGPYSSKPKASLQEQNMSYCRFQNTFGDLADCFEHWEQAKSSSEKNYRQKLFDLCEEIIDIYGDGWEDEEYEEDDEY